MDGEMQRYHSNERVVLLASNWRGSEDSKVM